MKGLLLSASLFLMAGAVVAGEMTDAEREVMKARQALTEKFGAAVANKNVAALVTELYTEDAVLQSLCPESPLAFGRDGYLKRLEGAVKNSGLRDSKTGCATERQHLERLKVQHARPLWCRKSAQASAP